MIGEARQASDWGVTFDAPQIDVAALRAWKEGVVGKLTGGLGDLCRRRKVAFVQGRAAFRSPNALVVRTESGHDEEVAFEHAILATGSRPAALPNLAVESPRILDSTAALALPDIPESLLVIGGGYIGLELGSVYAALGSRISVVEMTSGLLPGVDRDLVRVLSRRLQGRFAAVMLETSVTGLREEPGGIRVKLEGAGAAESEQVYEKVLVAVGRRPETDGLGLENTRVALDAQGFVQVDPQRRTHEPSIYAIGDITGEPMLAHKAAHEGRVAAQAIAGKKTAFEPQAIPAVVFTDPEIAWCGLTESQAKQLGRDVTIARFPLGRFGPRADAGSERRRYQAAHRPRNPARPRCRRCRQRRGGDDLRGRAGSRNGRAGLRSVAQHSSPPHPFRKSHGSCGRLLRLQHPRLPPVQGQVGSGFG